MPPHILSAEAESVFKAVQRKFATPHIPANNAFPEGKTNAIKETGRSKDAKNIATGFMKKDNGEKFRK